jgi:N-methylhydantoinase A
VAAFHDAHHRLYGYSFRDDPTQQVEWVNLRVTGIGPIRRPSLRPLSEEEERPPGAPEPHPPGRGAPEREGNRQPGPARGAVHTPTPPAHTPPATHTHNPSPTPTPAGSRPACFDPAHGFVDTAIYRRDDLRPGEVVGGPAVVEEYGATVPLAPGFRAEVDRLGNLIVSREESP